MRDVSHRIPAVSVMCTLKPRMCSLCQLRNKEDDDCMMEGESYADLTDLSTSRKGKNDQRTTKTRGRDGQVDQTRGMETWCKSQNTSGPIHDFAVSSNSEMNDIPIPKLPSLGCATC